jgi:DNA integrity scanning protein DisA with diadenylate cyclase activity
MFIEAMRRIQQLVTTPEIHATAVIRRKSKPNMVKLSFPFHVIGTASLSR